MYSYYSYPLLTARHPFLVFSVSPFERTFNQYHSSFEEICEDLFSKVYRQMSALQQQIIGDVDVLLNQLRKKDPSIVGVRISTVHQEGKPVEISKVYLRIIDQDSQGTEKDKNPPVVEVNTVDAVPVATSAVIQETEKEVSSAQTKQKHVLPIAVPIVEGKNDTTATATVE